MKKEKLPPPPVRSRAGFWAAALLLAFAAQGAWHAADKSATYDEMGHLTAGVLQWRTGHTLADPTHPPLLRYLLALPAWLTDLPLPALPLPLPQEASYSRRSVTDLYVYAAHFLYRNSVPADRILLDARLMNVLLGLLLGFIVYRWSSRLYGPEGGLLSLALFAFCPNLIAHSSLVTTDLGGVAFLMAFLYGFSLALREGKPGQVLSAGLLFGLALAAKFSNLALVPCVLAALFWADRSRGRPFPATLESLAILAAAAWFTLCALYRFQDVFIAHALTSEDWAALGYGKALQTLYRFLPLPDSFLGGLAGVALHDRRGHGAFLLGLHSGRGWWYYFPFAILVKTPAVSLLFLLSALASAFFPVEISEGGKNRKLDEGILAGTAAFLFALALGAGLNIGIRHALFIYPPAYILCGRLAAYLRRPAWRRTACALLLLLPVEVLGEAPNYLAFFNRPAGGPLKGLAYLSDSNLDWGQDLKNLAIFLKKAGNPEVVLSYFGTAVPQYYGIEYQWLPCGWAYPGSDHANSDEPRRELLAVSATNLQGTYFAQDLFGWLRSKKPLAVIGGSIYVYDVTRDLESQENLLGIYESANNRLLIARQKARIVKLRRKLSGG